jgi:membrane-bound lytic murein transglycosylase D
VPDVPETRRIIVKAGKQDTLVSLARRHNVSAVQIKEWNKLKSDKLAAGQKLLLNVPNKAVAKKPVHQVARGASAPHHKAAPAPSRKSAATPAKKHRS